jgi:PAS domain S-box-containing protein
MRQGRSKKGSGRSTRWGLPLSLGLYGLCAASLAGACLYFFLAYVPGRRAAVVNEWRQELVLRADLRKMTLDDWVAVGVADADILATYPTPRALIAGGAGSPTASPEADAAAHLREVAERFARMRGYLRFVLLDASLRIVVGVGAASQLERPDLQTAAEVLAQGKALVDFHRYADGRVAVVFLARVDLGTASRTGGGVVLLEADPNKWIYPYLARRPMAALSAETVLLRREGDDIVFLSPLRHHPAPPLTFRRPANVTGFAALAAVEGREGFSEYVDYRNEPVFAAVARLDRAPWGLVVKVDQRDALADYRREIRNTGATAALAFLAFWSVAFLLILAWRRRAAAALWGSEERARATLYSIGDAVIATDHNGRVEQLNPVAEKLTGWAQTDACGKHLDEVFRIVNEQTRTAVESPVARVLREGQVVGLANHTLLIGKDGSEHPIADSGAPIRDEKGEVTGVVLVFRDQTEERAAQRRYRDLFDNVGVALLRSTPGPEGGFVDVNPAMVAMFEADNREQLMAVRPSELYLDASQRRIVSDSIVTTGRIDAEVRFKTLKGKPIWCHITGVKTTAANGQICFDDTMEDITERKQAEEALRESQKALVEAQRVARVGSWEWDAVRDEITGSQEFYRLFDVAPEDIARFPQFAERLHPDDRARVEQDVAKALHLERPYDTDYRVKLRAGGWRDINARGQVFLDDGGKPLRMVGTCLDITERKQAEAELRIKNQAFEDSIASQSVADKDGTITHVNPAFLRLWGYATKEEATGKSVGTFFANPADATPVLEALAAHDAWEGEFLARRTDGSTFVSRGYATSLRSATGALIGYQSTNLDVTSERENAAALRESERKFRDTVRYLDEGYYSCTVDGSLREHNVAFNRILGFKPEEDLKGSKLPDFWQNPEDRNEYLRELMSKGIVRNFLINAKTIGGDKLVAMANSHLVKDDNGTPVRIEGTFTDFTEHKRMEERISHLNLVLKAIRNVNQLIVREKDPETLIRRSCEVLTETRGYFSAWIALYDESWKYLTAASAGLGAAFESLENRFRSGQLAACDKAVHERGVHVVRNPAMECPNCPAAMLYRGQSAIAVRLEHEKHIHGLLVMSMDAGLVDLVDEQNLIEEVADDIAYALHGLDVEARRGAAEEDLRKHRDQLEQRVRDRTAQLEESNKELEAFSYSVSHDLRAPLRAIDGFTRLLSDDYAPQLDTEGQRVCSVIHENTGKMSRLIDDLLAFSRLGRAEMSLSPIDMGTMAGSVFHELTTPESRARIDFQVGIVPPAVADPTLIRQVWMNLLSNAIKFSSKRDRAVIKVSARQNEGENVYAVQDDGAGFDMQYVGKLFGVFQRLHSSKEFEGTGVGLALVQRVIQRHGGRVWAEGETDKGATFYFALQEKGA